MASPDSVAAEDLKETPLHDLHVSLGGRMVPFAGYAMPVQFQGIIAEHSHTRTAAGLFDVSHMGQARVTGEGAGEALESLLPGDILALASGRMRYTQLTNEAGGIVDDLMVTRTGEDSFFLVVNAARKAVDFGLLAPALEDRGCRFDVLEDRALIALQGPEAGAALGTLAPGAADLVFLQGLETTCAGTPAFVTRSGYTGEDGFEISVPAEAAEAVARTLLDQPGVAPVGLGARDSLRLEAGLCLWGQDIDETTTPVEAGLTWSIGKRRRSEGGFPGADVIQRQIADGPTRRRVGIQPEGRAPVRHGAAILDGDGGEIGTVTSGGYGPTVEAPVAMGYVARAASAPGTALQLVVRGKPIAGRVAGLPFVEQRYRKG